MPRLLLALALSLPLSLLAPAADPKPAVKPKPVLVVGLTAPAPADWAAEKPANLLRSHQFKLPGDDGPAEVAIFKEGSAKVEQKFAEWKAQFKPAEGEPEPAVKTDKLTLAEGTTAHVLDLTGTWRYKPFPMAKTEELRPNSRAVWVIVTNDEGTAHVRLGGPAATVAKHYPAFEAWLKALK